MNISDKIFAEFLHNISAKQLISKNIKYIILGLSGGVDSVCLLNLLHRYANHINSNLRIICHHQNHMIRDEANSDEYFCQKICSDLNIQIFSDKNDIPNLSKEHSKGLEEMGRIIRYHNWNSLLEKISIENNVDKNDILIATAHHANDQAETVLLNLSRGTGLTGFSGIKPKYNQYIRPLLIFNKQDLYSYAKFNRLQWREDYTNNMINTRRNYLRLELIPSWQENTDIGLVDRIAKAADNIYEIELFLKNYFVSLYSDIIQNPPSVFHNSNYMYFNLKKFREINPHIKLQFLTYLLRMNNINKDISSINLNDILDLLEEDLGEKRINLSNNDIFVKSRTYFYIYNNEEIFLEPNTCNNISISLDKIFDNFKISNSSWIYYKISYNNLDKYINNNIFISSNIKSSELMLRKYQTGDYIIVSGKKVLLKDIFSKYQVPLNLRKNILLIAKNSEVFVVGNHLLSDDKSFTIAKSREDLELLINDNYEGYSWFNYE